MPKQTFTISATRDVDSVATTQSTLPFTSFSLNGAGSSGGTWKITNSGNSLGSGIAGARLRLANSTSGVDYTFTGKDQDGNAITEVLSGTAGTGVLDTVQYFSELTSVTTSGNVTSSEIIGTTYYYTTKSYPLNWRAAEPATYATYEPDGLGTSAFSVQEYFGPMTAPLATDGWNTLFAPGGLSATEGTTHATAVRLTMTATHGASLVFSVRSN